MECSPPWFTYCRHPVHHFPEAEAKMVPVVRHGGRHRGTRHRRRQRSHQRQRCKALECYGKFVWKYRYGTYRYQKFFILISEIRILALNAGLGQEANIVGALPTTGTDLKTFKKIRCGRYRTSTVPYVMK